MYAIPVNKWISCFLLLFLAIVFATIARGQVGSATAGRVSTGGQKGWVFGGFLTDYSAKKSETNYLKIAAERLQSENADFEHYADLYNFLNRIAPQLKSQNALAEIEFYKLQALAKSLEKIPSDKQNQSPYSNWTSVHDAKIVYSDPAGEWYVRVELFWKLSERFRSRPVADRIAWTAASTPIPGECEGYLSCYVSIQREAAGEYLKRNPRGEHAQEALQSLFDNFAVIIEGLNARKTHDPPMDPSERAQMRKSIGELLSIVRQTDGPKKQIVINQLNQISMSDSRSPWQ